MKTYNIHANELEIGGVETTAIILGEAGRGRKLQKILCPMDEEFLDYTFNRIGKVKLISSSSDEGWIARISTLTSYVRGANGNISTTDAFAEDIKILAHGQGAFGDAGRIGTWDDVLIATQLEKFWVRVKPSRGDGYILRFDRKVHKISFADAELLEMELMGSSPTSRGELIRL